MRYPLLFILVAPCLLTAQSIYLNNPSFEDAAQDATVPTGWFGCEVDSTPDVLPGQWGVYGEASDGDTYLGMITRGDGSREAIGQRLKQPLQLEQCYGFTIDVARSKTYASYNKPVKLRVWGGVNKCDQSQLLWETDVVEDIDWEEIKVEFTSQQAIRYIRFEAFYKEGRHPWMGNILIDNISAIKKCIRA